MTIYKNSVNVMWQKYRAENPTISNKFEAWAFGNSPSMADELGKLVMNGIKTGTSSLFYWYDQGLEPMPSVGSHVVLLDGEEEAMGIIRLIGVKIMPFNEVPETFAYLEGEGDRSLEYWRKVHTSFFTNECDELGIPFEEDALVVCEEFEVVYK
ncbi:ASCH domain-containing protein [Listeria innocua]|uniref:ASCH domain-containing protein n=1 Tax=Listeria innocua TaxID=1642 RepID=UPI0005F09EBD|nr:ASCH domain-containing protein [Listeria innocua]EAE6208129.1 ASCH domain-containing protein [Listeria innocua]EEP3927435.1 ASCH domain-containing protein [Listeria innocua]EIX7076645.1 ASCH domain-containing protein [Listeria innocua]EIX7078459.1 ASCH domain-containing protein [Listeria innocua]EIX7081672.1 ASCH domain-containing protein [Listeria innocua]